MVNFSNKVKKLYDLNQIIKNIADRYYVFPNGLIIIDDNDRAVDKGIHFSIIKNYDGSFNNEDIISYYDSKEIFNAFKFNKKDIENISININKLFLSGKDDLLLKIGICYHKNEILKNIKDYLSKALFILEEHTNESSILLSEKDKSLLLNKNLIICTDGRFKLRLCKELIPNLKEQDSVRIWFDVNESFIKNIFKAIIAVEKKEIINYHIYKAINY